MRNRRWFKIVCFDMVGDPESRRLKVAALPSQKRLRAGRSKTLGSVFGYGFGDPDMIEKIEITRPPWSVNAFAEAFARESFRHWDKLAESRTAIAQEREWLSKHIDLLGLHCNPSSANFILVDCGKDVGPLCTALLHHDILVRDCSSFGLPHCISVAVRTRQDNKILLEALSSCVP